MSLQCCLHACPSKELRRSDARARLRFQLDRIAGAPFSVDPKTGVADFHAVCWAECFESIGARRRSRARYVSAMRDAQETAEHFHSREKIQEEVDKAEKLLRESKSAVVFTGAGISTSAGIGDFRGIFGQWTEEDMEIKTEEEDEDGVPYEDLRPTLAHEAVAWLVEHGFVKFVISQNCDGLHGLSGIPKSKLSELHGNVFVEYCMKGCQKEYERPYYVVYDEADEYYEDLNENGRTKLVKPALAETCKRCQNSHRTERTCDCGKPLYDTLINFGDWLRDEQIGRAQQFAKRADCMMVLGSTLLVTPASDLCNNQKNLIICNRQKTEHDENAAVRAFADLDEFLGLLLKKLMGSANYKRWLRKRPTRMKSYDVHRQSSS